MSAVALVLWTIVPGPAVASIHRAPFLGLNPSYAAFASASGCGVVRAPVAPAWNLSSGKLTASIVERAPRCQDVPGTNADYFLIGTLGRNIQFRSIGNHTISATWNASFRVSWYATPYASCALNYSASISYCLSNAYIGVGAEAVLFDPTHPQGGHDLSVGTTFFIGEEYTMNFSTHTCGAKGCVVSGGNSTYGASGSLTILQNVSLLLNASGTHAITTTSLAYPLALEIGVWMYLDVGAHDATHATRGHAMAHFEALGPYRGVSLTNYTVK